MRYFTFAVLAAWLLFSVHVSASDEDRSPGTKSVEEELLALCGQWLDDYSEGRVERVAARFAPGAVVAIDAADSDKQRVMSAEDFITLVRQSLERGRTFREWLVGEPTVLVDHKIATVWAPYRVESPDRLAGGIDVFQFVRLDGDWKIVSLSYTNRKIVAREESSPTPSDAPNPPELGRVAWNRDLGPAIEETATSGKPTLLLFQEVPG